MEIRMRPEISPKLQAPLEGRAAFKVGVDKKTGQPRQLQAYAPVDAARVYNNFLSTGLTGEAGDLMKTAQKTFNAITMLKLGLSSLQARGHHGYCCHIQRSQRASRLGAMKRSEEGDPRADEFRNIIAPVLTCLRTPRACQSPEIYSARTAWRAKERNTTSSISR